MELLIFLGYMIIFIAIILIIYAYLYNKIKNQILRINKAESEIDESLRNKYDIITKLIAEITQVDKNVKVFKNIDKIKDEELSSFEFERKLYDLESQIYSIKNENTKLQKSKIMNELWYEIININTKIKAEKKYYNENTTIYNSLVTKFPSKIIAILLKYEEKAYFDGKDMYDENIKDFKI